MSRQADANLGTLERYDNVWITGISAQSGDIDNVDMRFDGTSWQAVPIPDVPGAEELAPTVLVTGDNDIWGTFGGGCSTLMPHCITDLQQWNGAYTSYQIPAVVTDMTSTADGVWLVAEDPASFDGQIGRIGRTMVYHWTGFAWQRVHGPWGSVRAQDQSITGSPDGDLWLSYRRKVKDRWTAVVWHRSSGKWTRIAVPSQLIFGDQPIVYDDHHGFWSLYAHWTGTKWTNAFAFANTGLSRDLGYGFDALFPAPIPGTTSAWAFACIPSHGTCYAAIALNGRLPIP